MKGVEKKPTELQAYIMIAALLERLKMDCELYEIGVGGTKIEIIKEETPEVQLLVETCRGIA